MISEMEFWVLWNLGNFASRWIPFRVTSCFSIRNSTFRRRQNTDKDNLLGLKYIRVRTEFSCFAVQLFAVFTEFSNCRMNSLS